MMVTGVIKPLHVGQLDSRIATLQVELEETRAAFHSLLDAVQPDIWNKKSPTSEWTYQQLFVHLLWALEMLPREVESARQGKGMFNLPKWISDAGSYWMIRWKARSVTPAVLHARYDHAMDALIRLIPSIPEVDWERGADFYGEGFHSVLDLFHGPAKHLKEHTSGF